MQVDDAGPGLGLLQDPRDFVKLEDPDMEKLETQTRELLLYFLSS